MKPKRLNVAGWMIVQTKEQGGTIAFICFFKLDHLDFNDFV